MKTVYEIGGYRVKKEDVSGPVSLWSDGDYIVVDPRGNIIASYSDLDDAIARADSEAGD